MVSINSIERRRRIRRAQELRAMFVDVLGILGFVFALMLGYIILMLLAQ
jgi:hypothetical protein